MIPLSLLRSAGVTMLLCVCLSFFESWWHASAMAFGFELFWIICYVPERDFRGLSWAQIKARLRTTSCRVSMSLEVLCCVAWGAVVLGPVTVEQMGPTAIRLPAITFVGTILHVLLKFFWPIPAFSEDEDDDDL